MGQTWGNGDWMEAVQAVTKLSPDYIERHGGAIKACRKSFEPYCLRQPALTMLAESGCDAFFTQARMAGHSSITITPRYCHLQANAIEREFENLSGGHEIGHDLELPAKKSSQ